MNAEITTSNGSGPAPSRNGSPATTAKAEFASQWNHQWRKRRWAPDWFTSSSFWNAACTTVVMLERAFGTAVGRQPVFAHQSSESSARGSYRICSHIGDGAHRMARRDAQATRRPVARREVLQPQAPCHQC